jgi:hypothetical protein
VAVPLVLFFSGETLAFGAGPQPPAPNAPANANPNAAAGANANGGNEPEPPAPAAPSPAIEEVHVVGSPRPPSRGASDFNLHVGELRAVPRQNATEILKLAPGILLTNEGGEGHAEQVFLRGFDAREGQDIEFTVGGVPINESGNLHGNGYADTHFIIPELVRDVRVVEGPFDPRQGNYAVAGSADYELGLAQRGFTAKYTGGSFNSHRALLLFGPNGYSDHTFGGVQISSTDGFGQNRDAQSASGIAQYEGRLGEIGTYRLTATGYSTHFHSAGVVREDDYRSGRMGFYDSYDTSSFAHEQTPQGGDSSRYSIAGDIATRVKDTALTQQVFVIKRDMRLLENFTGFLLDVQEPLQTPHAQRGDMLDLNVNELTAGAKGSARIRGKAFGERQELELGYFARGDDAKGTQERIEAATGVPYKKETDIDAQLGDIGLYADANLRATSWLAARGGARADVFTYSVLDNCAAQSVAHPSTTNPPVDQSCLTQQDFGRPREADQRSSTSTAAIMPRASILVGPFERVLFSASYGQGVRSVDPVYITQDIKTPFASVNAYEMGASFAGGWRDVEITARSIFFQTHVDKDLVFSETAGRNVLGVGTTRTGWAGAVRLTGDHFDESANLTLVRSAYDDTHLLVAYVPGVVLRSDTAAFAMMPFKIDGKPVKGVAAAGLTYVGSRPLPYGQKSGEIFTIDPSLTMAWTNFEIGLLATNVLDTKYRLGEYNFASDFHSQPQPTLVPERMFTAGPPRAIYGTLAIHFGGGG